MWKPVIWRQRLGRPECPYLVRWVLDLWLFSIRLYHWIGSDDPRAMHNHGSWFVSWILWGGYTDVHAGGSIKRGRWSITFRPWWWTHTVRVDPGGCWTLLLFGRETREWGFYVNGRFRKRNKYFFEHGHHPCGGSQHEE